MEFIRLSLFALTLWKFYYACLSRCLGKNVHPFSQEKTEFPITNLEQLSSHYYICVTMENILVLTSSENILILMSSLVRNL